MAQERSTGKKGSGRSGRCQGGFCMPRVIEILSRELNIPYSEIVKDTRNSFLFTGTIKDNMRAEDGDSDE